MLNTDPARADAFIELKQTMPALVDNLAVESPTTYEMLVPHVTFQQHEGLEEYFAHTVRSMVKGLPLRGEAMQNENEVEPDGESDEEIKQPNEDAVQGDDNQYLDPGS